MLLGAALLGTTSCGCGPWQGSVQAGVRGRSAGGPPTLLCEGARLCRTSSFPNRPLSSYPSTSHQPMMQQLSGSYQYHCHRGASVTPNRSRYTGRGWQCRPWSGKASVAPSLSSQVLGTSHPWGPDEACPRATYSGMVSPALEEGTTYVGITHCFCVCTGEA